MKNSDLTKLRQEIAMLEAKLETMFLIVSKAAEKPDDESARIIDVWTEHTIEAFLRLLKQRGLPQNDFSSWLPTGGADDG